MRARTWARAGSAASEKMAAAVRQLRGRSVWRALGSALWSAPSPLARGAPRAAGAPRTSCLPLPGRGARAAPRAAPPALPRTAPPASPRRRLRPPPLPLAVSPSLPRQAALATENAAAPDEERAKNMSHSLFHLPASAAGSVPGPLLRGRGPGGLLCPCL